LPFGLNISKYYRFLSTKRLGDVIEQMTDSLLFICTPRKQGQISLSLQDLLFCFQKALALGNHADFLRRIVYCRIRSDQAGLVIVPMKRAWLPVIGSN
jgi:hypothetical protein